MATNEIIGITWEHLESLCQLAVGTNLGTAMITYFHEDIKRAKALHLGIYNDVFDSLLTHSSQMTVIERQTLQILDQEYRLIEQTYRTHEKFYNVIHSQFTRLVCLISAIIAFIMLCISSINIDNLSHWQFYIAILINIPIFVLSIYITILSIVFNSYHPRVRNLERDIMSFRNRLILHPRIISPK